VETSLFRQVLVRRAELCDLPLARCRAAALVDSLSLRQVVAVSLVVDW
jgi:hypothetical protein